MKPSKAELFAVLRQYNPWWESSKVPDMPAWKRAAFDELKSWILNPPAPRAILLSGARQIGKTTLLLQAVQTVIDSGVNPESILYATFDHPMLKLVGLEGLLEVWKEFAAKPVDSKTEYFFIDEIQYTKDWQTWLKHQVDFEKNRRIVVTGSATPLTRELQESGVGRWHTIKLATLSFYEYLQIKDIKLPNIPVVASLNQLFDWNDTQLSKASQIATPLVPHFYEYLLRGGFPQTAQIPSVPIAQKLLREDIVDKVLKRDMTALYGVRHILELERIFLYICMHDGLILNVSDLCKNLEGIKRPTANNFLDLLEATHLIFRLPPYGGGKKILKAQYKTYLADPAIGPSVLLKGRGLLEDDTSLGCAAEGAFIKHVFSRFYEQSMRFSYWRENDNKEVDIIAEVQGRVIPFEVKYRNVGKTGLGELKGLRQFCETNEVDRAYVITKEISDFSILPHKYNHRDIKFLKIPAPLACYWLGQSELNSQERKGQTL